VWLRTPHTGPDGWSPESVIPGAFGDTAPRDILITYDGATLRTALAGSGRLQTMSLSPGSSLATLYRYVGSEELSRLDVGFLVLVFVIPGGIAAMADSSSSKSVLCTVWVILFPALFEAVRVVGCGLPVDLRHFAVTALVGGVVVTLVAGSLATLTSDVCVAGSLRELASKPTC